MGRDPRDSFEMLHRALEEDLHTRTIIDFVRESNKIEGITSKPTGDQMAFVHSFLSIDKVDAGSMHAFLDFFEPKAEFRCKPGMNVIIHTGNVVNHRPIPGGPEVERKFEQVLEAANEGVHPWIVHQEYETLHPYMDGNGRSGRILWAWQMLNQKITPGISLGFLHAWYYQSLEHGR